MTGAIMEKAEITRSTELIAQLSLRKSNLYTERRVFPYATQEHLRLKELMPIVRQKADSRFPGHPWMELANSLGISEATVTRQIKKLKEAKRIERIGSTHGRWVVTEN
jgi:predicted HTH transcriptional regulator